MPTVQLIRVSVNDAFTADPSLFDKLREGATKAGIVKQSFGFGVEEPTQLYWILHFDQGFEPTESVWPTNEYGNFTEGLMGISTEVTKTLLTFESFSAETIKAPLTEITILTLKDGAKIEEFKSVIDPFQAGFASEVPTSWAVNSFNDREVFLFAGWDSVETHAEFNGTPEFLKYKTDMSKFMAAPPKMRHVKLADHLTSPIRSSF
ncbi:hypothetical protein PILCRDRAFT_89050 [Piloderma croceum F 1598]|uniref:ABM domain-containing protein n=1 Tax=Piloderma croceum (strain F 1598) TaxID=765440 RepID=A0A0C3BW20_PILCF|nr:hypothetical protein PILCRDRAFT_89050 [Piloderma croceum F 1598]